MIETIKLFNDQIVNLRFDLGTARIIKDISGNDPISTDVTKDIDDIGSVIFLSGIKRFNQLYKQPQGDSDEYLKELYYTLDRADALRIISSFNAAMSVKKTTAEELIDNTIKDTQAKNEDVQTTEDPKKP